MYSCYLALHSLAHAGYSLASGTFTTTVVDTHLWGCGLALARVSRIFSSNLGGGRFHRKFHAIWVRFRLSNGQRQSREISHFLIPSWPTSSSRPRKRPSPSRQPVTLAAATAPPPPPIAVTLAAAVTPAAYLRAACVLPPVPRSINCTKVATFEFHFKDSALPRRRIFMQLSRNLGPKNRNYAMKFGRPPDATLA